MIIRTAGTNCDRELAHGFEQAGAAVETVHLNQLIGRPEMIEQAQIIGLPGGFSYGDDIAAGRIFANRLRHRLFEPLQAAVKRGVPMIGICNGFQVLVKLGLLPDGTGRQTATLTDNTSGRFVDRWVKLQVCDRTVCIWTRGLQELELPVAHGEGKFLCHDDRILQRLRDHGQVALRYAPDDNPNGSVDNIAGVCDPTGVVIGLMPHPERCVHLTHQPAWTRRRQTADRMPAGLRMLEAAVAHVSHPVGS